MPKSFSLADLRKLKQKLDPYMKHGDILMPFIQCTQLKRLPNKPPELNRSLICLKEKGHTGRHKFVTKMWGIPYSEGFATLDSGNGETRLVDVIR
jgi:hypothetical protein